MDKINKQFSTATKNLESFLEKNNNRSVKLKKLTKSLYDKILQNVGSSDVSSAVLPELIINNFDNEQIWQQIELLNTEIWGVFREKVVKCEASRNNSYKTSTTKEQTDENKADSMLKYDDNVEEINDSDSSSINEEAGSESVSGNDIDEEDDVSDEEDADNTTFECVNKKLKTSSVDDQFFKLDEMEQFLESEEKRGNRSGGDDDDGMDELSDDSGLEDDEDNFNEIKYSDFFDPPRSEEKSERKRKLEADEEDESIKKKSTLEVRQERLSEKIMVLEEENLAEKPWRLKGETTAESRKEDALLEEYLDFDQGVRQAPVDTADLNSLIEKVIKQRVKDRAWDDVERKIRPKTDPYEYKKKLLLDQEKSKKSLADIYEDEYQKQQGKRNDEDETENSSKQHKEINDLMDNIFTKLDTLSNFHYTPKILKPSVKIINKLPSISMEEVQPTTSSDATILAPEEIEKKRELELVGADERSETDKKRMRRKKKLKQRANKTALMKKKELKKLKKSKAPKSSTAFFEQLQETVSSQVHGNKKKKVAK